MISNQEEDEFIAVRVQDPRVQNEGSWNSYVDYKIFLHTNSKAFTAKTSCVRRRYSEFAWLKKKLQKNAGLVPVPDLPAKSFFFFSNEDFLEGRRKGLQAFLDKVLHMTVCLSDSQLHLFLQTQLPVGHIQDCVQGHTPYSVTDAILTYASSNRGYAQAQQEDDSMKEHSLTVSYESMESPLPHQPCPPSKETFNPEPDRVESRLQLSNNGTVDPQHGEKSSIKVIQRNNHLEAIVEDGDKATDVIFFLGDSQEDIENQSHQIRTPVEVHCTAGTGFQMNSEQDSDSEEVSSSRESNVTSDTIEEQTAAHPGSDEQPDQEESSQKANLDMEMCVNSVAVLDVKDSDDGISEDVLKDVCSEVTEKYNISEVADVSCLKEMRDTEEQNDPDDEGRIKSESGEVAPHVSEILGEGHNVQIVPQIQGGDTETQMDQKHVEQEVDFVETKGESDKEVHSLHSSNESIMKVSDEESMCDEIEESVKDEIDFVKTSPKEEVLWSEGRNILDLHTNGYPEGRDGDAVQAEDLQYVTDIKDLSNSLDVNSTLTSGDQTENSDFSILETSCSPGLSDRKYREEEALLPGESPEVEAC